MKFQQALDQVEAGALVKYNDIIVGMVLATATATRVNGNTISTNTTKYIVVFKDGKPGMNFEPNCEEMLADTWEVVSE